MRYPREVTSQRAEQAVDLYAVGLSMREVAERLQMSKCTVNLLVQAAGIARPKIQKRKVTPAMVAFEDSVIREYRSGKSMRQIAVLTGLSITGIHLILKRRNEPRRNRRYLGKCVDCGKPSGVNQRCEFHRRVRRAEMCRWWDRERRQVPEHRWRVSD